MAATRLTAGSNREVVPAETLSEVADEMLGLARQAGRELRARSKGKLYVTKPGKPTVDDEAFKTVLTDALEDEFIPAVETDDDRIQPSDLDHELIKKALVSLKLKGLRKVAEQEELNRSGSLEDLAVAIARKYRWNEAQIARLVLENEPAPDAARSFVTRLYPLSSEPDVDHALHRVSGFIGRYIRIGIARWFVFDDAASADGGFNLVGTYKAFAAQIADENDIPTVERIAGREGQVTARVASTPVVHMTGANSVEAHAARAAIEAATKIEFRGYLPVYPLDDAIDISPETLLMTDLITTRFRQAGFVAPRPNRSAIPSH